MKYWQRATGNRTARYDQGQPMYSSMDYQEKTPGCWDCYVADDDVLAESCNGSDMHNRMNWPPNHPHHYGGGGGPYADQGGVPYADQRQVQMFSFVGEGHGQWQPEEAISYDGWKVRPCVTCLMVLAAASVATWGFSLVTMRTGLGMSSSTPRNMERRDIYNCWDNTTWAAERAAYCCAKYKQRCQGILFNAPGPSDAQLSGPSAKPPETSTPPPTPPWTSTFRTLQNLPQTPPAAPVVTSPPGLPPYTPPPRSPYVSPVTPPPTALPSARPLLGGLRETMPPGEPPPAAIECSIDLKDWEQKWPAKKKVMCCSLFGKGCQTAPAASSSPGSTAVAALPLPGATETRFNCVAQYESWQTSWPPPQQRWCCLHFGRACPPPPSTTKGPAEVLLAPKPAMHFNCDTHREDWAAGWSAKRKVWCCEHFGRGCPTPPPSSNFGNVVAS